MCACGQHKESPEGVGRHMRVHDSGLCACETYSRPIGEELTTVCNATEGENIKLSVCFFLKVSKNLTAWLSLVAEKMKAKGNLFCRQWVAAITLRNGLVEKLGMYIWKTIINLFF